MAGFAIGVAFSIVLLVSVAAPAVSNGFDHGWLLSFAVLDSFLTTNIAETVGSSPSSLFIDTLPKTVEEFVFENFTLAFPPIVDATIIGVLLTMVMLNMLTGFVRRPNIAPANVTFLPKEFFLLISNLVSGLLFAILGAFVESNTDG